MELHPVRDNRSVVVGDVKSNKSSGGEVKNKSLFDKIAKAVIGLPKQIIKFFRACLYADVGSSNKRASDAPALPQSAHQIKKLAQQNMISKQSDKPELKKQNPSPHVDLKSRDSQKDKPVSIDAHIRADQMEAFEADLEMYKKGEIHGIVLRNYFDTAKHAVEFAASRGLPVDLIGFEEISNADLQRLKGNKDIAFVRLDTRCTVNDEGLKILATMPNLKELHLNGNGAITSQGMQVLGNLTQLNYLNLEATSAQNLSFLSKLKNLETLHLAGTSITDIDAVANLPKLRKLDISDTDVTDIAAVANLTKLKHFKVEGCKTVVFDQLAKMGWA